MVKSQITRGKKQKKLYGNLAVFLFSIAAVLVLVITIYTSVLVNVFSHYLQKSIESRILGVSRAAAALISEEELGDLKRAEDMDARE